MPEPRRTLAKSRDLSVTILCNLFPAAKRLLTFTRLLSWA